MVHSKNEALGTFAAKKRTPWPRGSDVAEREGFEPSIPFGIRVFETRALGQLCDLSNASKYSTGEAGASKQTGRVSMKDKLEELRQMRAKAKMGGGAERIADQHARGKLTARERIDALLDRDSFQELGRLATHNIADFGMAEQEVRRRRRGHRLRQDRRPPGGRLCPGFHRAGRLLLRSPVAQGLQDHGTGHGRAACPVIGLLDSGGARIQEGVRSLAAYGELFVRNVMASGVVPQISVQMGPCAGGAVYSPALTDFIIMVRKTSFMFITGPDVIKAVTGEEVDFEHAGRGGGPQHRRAAWRSSRPPTSGRRCDLVKELLSYLPQNNMRGPAAR